MISYDPYAWYWVVAGDKTRVWSSVAGGYVPIDDADYLAWQTASPLARPTPIESEDALTGVLEEYPDLAAPGPWRVPTYVIIRRLEAAGLLPTAIAALKADEVAYHRFMTAGDLASDEPEARAFLGSIGADADVVLAPDA